MKNNPQGKIRKVSKKAKVTVTKEGFFVVIRSKDDRAFAKKIVEVERKRWKQVAGVDSIFHNGTEHIAYYVDTAMYAKMFPQEEAKPRPKPPADDRVGKAYA